MNTSGGIFWRFALAGFFIIAGAYHFINPRPYLAMMPPYLPAHEELVWISGGAEILGGLGVISRRTRFLAGWGLIALLIAVFPANLNAALKGWPGVNLPAWILWARLPVQFLFFWWVYKVCLEKPEKE